MTRRLILCFDGTWNTVKDHTNVSRIHAAIAALPDGQGGDSQIKYYDEGVGTYWYDKIRGGMLGYGLSKNVIQGYKWLIQHYQEGSEIYLFGFSRGAFTARSLAGLIGRCNIAYLPQGVNNSELEERVKRLAEEAYDIYRESKEPDDASRAFVKDKAHFGVRIKFIGVWDTVGALGVPLVGLNILERFHDTKLGAHVDNAYHALAVDEHRKDYATALWTANPGNAKLEQRWFPGAHANVGGGYEDDLLPDPPLKWIAERARDCGLVVSDDVMRLDGNEYRAPVRDSYREFMYGAYRMVKFGRRHYRTIGTTINEVVDETVYKKWAADPEYRPLNLAHAGGAIASPGVGLVAADARL